MSFDEDEDLAGEAFVPEEVVFEDDGRLTVAVERDDADLLVDDDERETELEDERDIAADVLADNLIDTKV